MEIEKHILQQIKELQDLKEISLTYLLKEDSLSISYEEFQSITHKTKKNRVMSIDLYSNNIGWSIVDWYSSNNFRVIKSGVIDLYQFFDFENRCKLNNIERKPYNRKRKHEIILVCKFLINLAIYYQCSIFGIEDLNIKASDKGKGRSYNRQCNNTWYRNLIVYQIRKRCFLNNIRLQEVKVEYSSYIGNFVFRSLGLPDMVLASIEIGRRVYEFIRTIHRQKK